MQVDELKYHGGGIGVTFEGRGTLSPSVDLLGAAPAAAAPGAACIASTEDGFECMSSQLGGEVIIHYNLRTPTGAAPPHPARCETSRRPDFCVCMGCL